MYGKKVEIPHGCDNGEGSYLFQHEQTSDLSLAPSSTLVSFDDITIYRIGGGEILPRCFTLLVFLLRAALLGQGSAACQLHIPRPPLSRWFFSSLIVIFLSTIARVPLGTMILSE